MSTGGSAGSRRRERALLAAAVVLGAAVAVLAYLTWTARAEAAANAVRVTATGSPGCAPGRTVNREEAVLVVATLDLRCMVDVTVTNDSGRTVRLDAVVLPDVGISTPDEEQRGARVVMADAAVVEPRVDDPDAGPASSPATYDVDQALAPGESTRVAVVLVGNPSACRSAAAAVVSISPWPQVVLSVGGKQFDRAPPTRLDSRWARGRLDQTADCDT